jgi:FkbM family methyltransferase
LYRLLRLSKEHVLIRSRLTRPVSFVADLDLHAWSQRIAFLTGGYEPATTEFLLRLYSTSGRRGYLLDVGANIGLVTIPLALANDCETPVIAVEAVPDNIDALLRNVDANGLNDRIKVLPVGLGDAPKTVYIQIEGDLHSGEGTGTANILPDGSTYECVRQELRIDTLDGLVASGQLPNGCSVMKIDTDGYDLKVLQGGTGFLQRNRPVIFGEFAAHCMAWHGQSLDDVRQFASSQGYVVWLQNQRSRRFVISYDSGSFVQDLLLVPDEKTSQLRWCLEAS